MAEIIIFVSSCKYSVFRANKEVIKPIDGCVLNDVQTNAPWTSAPLTDAPWTGAPRITPLSSHLG